jgi:acyl CoA:acetate/3-ketoacid CoA transferase beta subunit
MIVSDLAVIEVTAEGLVLRARAPGVSAEEVVSATGAPLSFLGSVPEIKI